MNFKSFISTLTQTLNWHKDRCETFNCMVMGLIDQGNVQHHALATPLKTEGTLKSKLERIRRFFANQDIDYDAFSLQMVTKVFKEIPMMDLILDRTNWKFGKQDINFLVLAAKVGPVTFPLFFSLLDHQGCSDFEQRQTLLEKFRKTFGFHFIRSFTADREFIGKEWIQYLCDHDIPFLSVLRTTASPNGAKAKDPLRISLFIFKKAKKGPFTI
jgi:hypothetical protein